MPMRMKLPFSYREHRKGGNSADLLNRRSKVVQQVSGRLRMKSMDVSLP